MGRRRNSSTPQKKRSQSENSSSSSQKSNEYLADSQPFVPYLSHVTAGCSVEDVDPSACIPLFLARGRSENAVRRLKAIINGKGITDAGYDNSHDTTLTGFVSGSPTSVVVPLVGDLAYLIDEYFEQRNFSSDDAELKKAEHSEWRGVVDGCQLHGAIIGSLEENYAKWSPFRWKVFVLRPGLPLAEYRKLSIVQNERCRQANHFEPTLYDLLKGLRLAYDTLYARLLKESRTGTRGISLTHRDVAEDYDGGSHEKNTTVKQAVSLAIRLCPVAIEAIGSITNMTCAEDILNCGKLNSRKLTSTDAVMEAYDCRLFKNFLCPSTLRAAGNFINALKEEDGVAQVNAIHRARHWSELNDYKPLKACVLNEQFRYAKLALHEEAKFLSRIGSNTWPQQMETTKDNLLRTTVFDEDLRVNEGNDNDVLLSLWSYFKKIYPAKARGIEQIEVRDETHGNNGESQTLPPEPPSANDEREIDVEQERLLKEAEEQNKYEEEKRQEAVRRRGLRLKADEYLQECGISTYQMSIDAFLKDVWGTNSMRVDLVVSTLPSTYRADEVQKLASFCRATLKTGSYIVLVIREDQFATLGDTFAAASFKVCEHSYKVLYDPCTLRKRKNTDFPQRQDDVCFIAKSKGAHPKSFVPDFATAQESSCPSKVSVSSFASVLNIQACANKLKPPKQNTPLYSDERSIDLFVHLIRLFSPSGGSVLDPFSGALTVSLACMQTSRTCISIDNSGPGTKYAIGRLRVFATPNATMEKLDAYIDEPNEQQMDYCRKQDELTPLVACDDSHNVADDRDNDQRVEEDCGADKDEQEALSTQSASLSQYAWVPDDDDGTSDLGHQSDGVQTRASKKRKVPSDGTQHDDFEEANNDDVDRANVLLSMTQR